MKAIVILAGACFMATFAGVAAQPRPRSAKCRQQTILLE